MKLTLAKLKKLGACDAGIQWFTQQYGTTALLKQAIEACVSLGEFSKLEWCNWLLPRLMGHENQIRYAIYAAELVLDIFEKQNADDKRPRMAIEAAKNVLKNPSRANKDAARSAARSAESAAESAARSAESAESARSAVWSAWSAAWSAWSAESAAESAVESAARSAESAAWSAESAAWSARFALLLKIIQFGLSLLCK